ncbi:hypothetical protein OIU79_009559 [Salix purpurea]|uniref:Uncharacterized protein n=1 Tax=Salix purpurea TaxID=77065 RepID=A0A9Q0QDN1_SALPP|nr:hypothetical protein OIU79_009559 [Salix purpurea]
MGFTGTLLQNPQRIPPPDLCPAAYKASRAPVDHLYIYHLLDKGSHFQLKLGGISSDEQLQLPQETMRLLLCAGRSSSYQTVPTEASCHLQKGENPTNPWHYYTCMENPELASRACLQHSFLKTWA